MFGLNPQENYRNYRWFFTSDGTLVVGGKSDEQNETAINNFIKSKYTVMHTSKPGSPFMIIQKENPSEKDLNETAIFTACFSQQWKKGAKTIEIDIFKGSQLYKSKLMKKGTFGIRGGKESVKIKPKLDLIIQKGKLRAVPFAEKSQKLGEIKPGKLDKEDVANKIAKKISDKFHYPVSKEEILQAIPSDKLGFK